MGRQFSVAVGDVTAMWAPLETDLGPDPFTTDAYNSPFPDNFVSWQHIKNIDLNILQPKN